MYVRFESPVANRHGTRLGIFVLMNGLAHEGKLSPTQHHEWRTTNDWFNEAYPNPSHLDPTIYDRAVNPGAVAWFKEGATHLMERVPAYLAILASHGVECVRRTTADPGHIIYEDDAQVVAIPKQEPRKCDDHSKTPTEG